jgi:hypothetical protein
MKLSRAHQPKGSLMACRGEVQVLDGGSRRHLGLWPCDIGGISNGRAVCSIATDGGDYRFLRPGNRLWGMASE